MPMFDMPVEELEKYQGKNPRPADFEEYWEKALFEMRAVDPQIVMTKAEFQAPGVECCDLYFTGVNGARIYAKHLRPTSITGKIPAVLMFHGYRVDSGYWVHKLIYAAMGYAVFAMDVRGQGGKSEDVGGVKGNTLHGHIIRGLDEADPHKLLMRDIFLDTAMMARIAFDMDFVDETRVYVTGGSQGGALALACAALEPRIAKAAVLYPFLSDYKRVWEMNPQTLGYSELREYFRSFDPRHQREEEVFTKLGYVDLQHHAHQIKGDTLMITGLEDTSCPPSTQYAVYNKLTCRKKHLLYPDFGHEDTPEVQDILFEFLVNGKYMD